MLKGVSYWTRNARASLRIPSAKTTVTAPNPDPCWSHRPAPERAFGVVADLGQIPEKIWVIHGRRIWCEARGGSVGDIDSSNLNSC